MRLVLIKVGLIGIFISGGAIQPQQAIAPDESVSPTLQITSRAVLLDVIVTDSSGRPVTGIPQSAFSVTEDRKPQDISFFEEHASQPIAADIPKLPPDVFSNFSPFPEPPVVNVLLLDSLNTPMDHQSYMHAQVLKYLSQTRSGTRTAVFSMGLGLHFIQGFTDDPALVQAALESTKNQWVGNPGMLNSTAEGDTQQRLVGFMNQAVDSYGNTAANPEMTAALQRFMATNSGSRDDDRQLITLENLRRLALYLEGVPGRKNIIWFSEKVPAAFSCAGSGNPAIKDLIKKTLAMLATTRAVMYPVDPRGLAADEFFTAVNTNGDARLISKEHQARFCDQAAAEILGQQSGGRAFINTNAFPQVIEKISNDSNYFYTMSYVPKNTRMDGTYREIGVKVAGANYTLSYRSGYYAVDSAIPGSAMKRWSDKAQQLAARNPGAVNPLLQFMTLGMPQAQQIDYQARVTPSAPPANARADKKGKSFYSVDLTIDLRNLELKPEANGSHTGALNVSLLVYDRYGNVVSHEDRVAQLEIKPGAYAAMQQSGLKLHNDLSLPNGNYWLRTGVYDQRSQKVGTLEIPLTAVTPLEPTATEQTSKVPSSNAEPITDSPSKQGKAQGVAQSDLPQSSPANGVPLSPTMGLEPAFTRERSKDPTNDVKLSVGADKNDPAQSKPQGHVPRLLPSKEPPNSRAITVQQLQQLLGEIRGASDQQSAKEIAGIKLTERLSTIRLARLMDSLPGERSRSALLAMADVSAFLPLPSEDLIYEPSPDPATQKTMLSKAVDFVLSTTSRMPNFLAEKRTLRFQNKKPAISSNDPVVVVPDHYYLVDSNAATVRYRDGRDEELHSSKQAAAWEPQIGLTTRGIFGPMLQAVMRDILKGKIGWGYWEQSTSGPMAVFRYLVPKEQATFSVTWCCVATGPGVLKKVQAIPGYHGEISIDPESGAIVRLALIADMEESQPVSTANIFVEYGQIAIGGKTYMCPTRNSTVLVAKTPAAHVTSAQGGEVAWHQPVDNVSVTAVEDTHFDQYHVFRSEMKIVVN